MYGVKIARMGVESMASIFRAQTEVCATGLQLRALVWSFFGLEMLKGVEEIRN